jgi:hypothetical protein
VKAVAPMVVLEAGRVAASTVEPGAMVVHTGVVDWAAAAVRAAAE